MNPFLVNNNISISTTFVWPYELETLTCRPFCQVHPESTTVSSSGLRKDSYFWTPCKMQNKYFCSRIRKDIIISHWQSNISTSDQLLLWVWFFGILQSLQERWEPYKAPPIAGAKNCFAGLVGASRDANAKRTKQWSDVPVTRFIAHIPLWHEKDSKKISMQAYSWNRAHIRHPESTSDHSYRESAYGLVWSGMYAWPTNRSLYQFRKRTLVDRMELLV